MNRPSVLDMSGTTVTGGEASASRRASKFAFALSFQTRLVASVRDALVLAEGEVRLLLEREQRSRHGSEARHRGAVPRGHAEEAAQLDDSGRARVLAHGAEVRGILADLAA